MYLRLLDFLRCPDCGAEFTLVPLDGAAGDEVSEGLLRCASGHHFPVAGGIPRLLPDSLEEHRARLAELVRADAPALVREVLGAPAAAGRDYDRRTRENFAEEWGYHDTGGKTWGMDLENRIRWFFLDPIRLPAEELRGKVVLDAGCGNGSQSVAYTRYGMEVIAIDLSTGLEHGHAFRRSCPGADPTRVHFVQADLQRPPLARESVDIIHSAGVLHHTPDTLRTWRALRPLLKPGGTFYVWFYKREPYVTPVVNAIRAVTTRMSARNFARVSRLMAAPFQGFCAATNALGVRQYPRLSRREAALALMDIFGAPYAHSHTFDEVDGWYRAEGFVETWGCNEGRRGFGVCGRLASAGAEEKAAASAPAMAEVSTGGVA